MDGVHNQTSVYKINLPADGCLLVTRLSRQINLQNLKPQRKKKERICYRCYFFFFFNSCCESKKSKKSKVSQYTSQEPMKRNKEGSFSLRCGRENPRELHQGIEGLKTQSTKCSRRDLNRGPRGRRRGKIQQTQYKSLCSQVLIYTPMMK